jgi:ribosomal protein S18 acetylase RimI-like enzyme
MITISEATSEDFKSVQQIVDQTWPVAYGEILEKAQLDYMIATFYSDEALRSSVLERGHHFLMAKEGDVSLGFASYEHISNKKSVTKIHKIYILPHTQGKGMGKKLIAAIEAIARRNHSQALSLNVNRFNTALGFYQKLGFEIVGEEDIKLDHGYLMEDYMMEKGL